MRDREIFRPKKWLWTPSRFPEARAEVEGLPRVGGDGDGMVWGIRQTGHPRVQAMVPTSEEVEGSPIWVTEEVSRRLMETVGRVPAESGGPLGGDRRRGIVDSFVPDEFAGASGATYSPDVQWLNDMLKTEWDPRGVSLMGFAHSHPPGSLTPSQGDREYAADLLAAMPALDRLLLPIVQSAADVSRGRST